MRRLLSLLVLSSVALLGSAFGQTGGRDLYIAKCSACHAPDGSGDSTIGRSLKLGDIRPSIKGMIDEQLRRIMLDGKGKMPPLKKFDDEKISNLTVFLRDLAAGNPDAGRAVAKAQAQPLPHVEQVFRDKCSACHARDGSGRTTIGKSLHIPDLTSSSLQSKTDKELATMINGGKGRMPSYVKTFNVVQVGQLVSYVRTINKTANEKAPGLSGQSQLSVPPPPSRSSQIMPQQAAISPAPSPVDTAPLNLPKETERRTAEPNTVALPAIKEKPLTGRQMYVAKCSACHSSDGSGIGTIGKSMKIPSLASPQVQVKSDQALAEVISNGVGKMPASKKRYTSEQILLLVSYIRELGKKH